jgi:hypothetical protein
MKASTINKTNTYESDRFLSENISVFENNKYTAGTEKPAGL